MKIIIDIPDYEYRHIKEVYEKNDIVENTYSYIYYGTPLDDVKAEILKYSSEHYVHDDDVWTYIGIIDKHIGKAESEDKE